MTLLAFAAVCHAAYPAAPIDRYLCRRVVQQLIDIACLRGPQQQTRRTLLQRPIDGTDRWTDTVPLHRLSHTVRAVLKSRQRDRQRERPTEHAISLINESWQWVDWQGHESWVMGSTVGSTLCPLNRTDNITTHRHSPNVTSPGTRLLEPIGLICPKTNSSCNHNRFIVCSWNRLLW